MAISICTKYLYLALQYLKHIDPDSANWPSTFVETPSPARGLFARERYTCCHTNRPFLIYFNFAKNRPIFDKHTQHPYSPCISRHHQQLTRAKIRRPKPQVLHHTKKKSFASSSAPRARRPCTHTRAHRSERAPPAGPRPRVTPHDRN